MTMERKEIVVRKEVQGCLEKRAQMEHLGFQGLLEHLENKVNRANLAYRDLKVPLERTDREENAVVLEYRAPLGTPAPTVLLANLGNLELEASTAVMVLKLRRKNRR